MIDPYTNDRAEREQDDREAEQAIAAMSKEERAELTYLARDYSRRRHAMMRALWASRAPSLRACAAVSAAALVVLILAWR